MANQHEVRVTDAGHQLRLLSLRGDTPDNPIGISVVLKGIRRAEIGVTALLTIGGYSLTDTVVVFDRIRENIRLRKKSTFSETINLSVNEVLSRTVITSLTTFMACIALLLFGGVVLKNFSLALALGIIIGTYSSVFVASPIVARWRGEKMVQVKR